jgi:ferrochelatase
MGMQTSEAIKGLARLGKKQVVLIPIAFTSDHIETLYELDLEYVREAREVRSLPSDQSSLCIYTLDGNPQLGMEVHRADSLNDSPVFIRALADIAAQHLREYGPGKNSVSTQMLLRCPGCKNATCGHQKSWFAQGGL